MLHLLTVAPCDDHVPVTTLKNQFEMVAMASHFAENFKNKKSHDLFDNPEVSERSER
jgi:hypothetical protein